MTPECRELTGRDALVLESGAAWRLETGALAVFLVGPPPEHRRRFLFEAAPGQLLYGHAPGTPTDWRLEALPLEPSRVVAIAAQTSAAEAGPWLSALVTAAGEEASGELTLDRRTLALEQARVIQRITERDARDREAERKRYRARAYGERFAMTEALSDLQALLHPVEQVAKSGGEPLLVAVRAIGTRLGFEARPPARSEEVHTDPLLAIARASGVRLRRVTLVPDWFRGDAGPLLAFLDAERAPVALLPIMGGRYDLFDPRTRTREHVTPALAARLDPAAVTFYAPLPAGLHTPIALMRFAIRNRGRDVVMLIALGLASAALALILPWALGALIGRVIPDDDKRLLLELGAALFINALGATIFQVSRGLYALRLQTSAEIHTQSAVWDRVLNLPAPFFRRFAAGDLNARILGVSELCRRWSQALLTGFASAAFALAQLAFMLMVSPVLTLIALALTFASLAITLPGGLWLAREARALQAHEGGLQGLVVQLVQGVTKLRVAAAEDRAFVHWGRRYRDKKALELQMGWLDDAIRVINQVLPIGATAALYAGAWAFGVLTVHHGVDSMAVGDFVAFTAAFGAFGAATASLASTALELIDGAALWQRVAPLLAEPPEVAPGRTDCGRLSGRLALSHVTFRYQEGGRAILEDLSLELEPGEHIALVGPSGCGKSTIFRLLLGFERPESGAIYYDGLDLRKLDPRAVRRQIGTVLQSGRLQAGSLFENIAGGAAISLDEAWEAVRLAGLEPDLKAMPMGLHTMVAEGGTNLSGGQRQRVLIARAFALRPRIVLFDEATSALDNETQAIVAASMASLHVSRISIAHRLSTIREADRIVVLDQGRVVESGRFEELLAHDGMFARLVAHQMA